MKSNSVKFRTLFAIHTLWKYTDENHKVSSPQVSKHLEPYGLNYTNKALRDTVHKLRELGLDIHSQEDNCIRDVWWGNRPLDNDTLDKLIFAVKSNPYITKEQQNDIMASISPFVTAYQEDKLTRPIEHLDISSINTDIYRFYSDIQCAIEQNKKIVYTQKYIKYNNKTIMPEEAISTNRIFTPKSVCASNTNLYLFGYNHTIRQIQAIPMDDIVTLRLAYYQAAGHEEKSVATRKLLDAANPNEYIFKKDLTVIYEGPVTIHCRVPYLQDVFRHFGPPSAPIEKSHNGKTTYLVDRATITDETLCWLSSVPNHGIRIIEPVEAVNAIKEYYDAMGKKLTSKKLFTYKMNNA